MLASLRGHARYRLAVCVMGVIERTYRALSADRGAILRRQVFRHLNDPVDRRAQAAVTLLVTRARLSRTGEHHQTPDDATSY